MLDLFAGPGGWSHALTVSGARDIGLKWDSWACKTRARVVQLDLARNRGRSRPGGSACLDHFDPQVSTGLHC